MAWIESHQSLQRHYKTLDLMNQMNWGLDETIGKLHRVWWWCIDYAPDGDLRKHSHERLGSAVGLTGEEAKKFVSAMIKVGFLDRKPYFRIHDWWTYVGRFLQVKYKQYPEKWNKIKDLYSTDKNRSKNRSKGGSKNPIPTNLTNQPNQPNQTDKKESFREKDKHLSSTIREFTSNLKGICQDKGREAVGAEATEEAFERKEMLSQQVKDLQGQK